jgi:hypothetical protein
MDDHKPHPTHPLMKEELGEGDYKYCLPGTEVPIATCSGAFKDYIGLAHRMHTSSIIGKTTLQAIAWKLMGHRQRWAQCHQQDWHRWFEPQCLCWSAQINVKEQMHILFRFQHTQLVKQNWHSTLGFKNWRQAVTQGHYTSLFPATQINYWWRDYKENWPYVQKLSVSVKIQRVPPRSQGIESH